MVFFQIIYFFWFIKTDVSVVVSGFEKAGASKFIFWSF